MVRRWSGLSGITQAFAYLLRCLVRREIDQQRDEPGDLRRGVRRAAHQSPAPPGERRRNIPPRRE